MKKIVIVLFLFTLSTIVFAQTNCTLCGDWIGNYSIEDFDSDGRFFNENRKMYIRVQNNGDKMSIRVKTFPTKDPSDVKYWNDCKITRSTDKKITFYSFIFTSDDWSGAEKKNGIVICKANHFVSCVLTYVDGRVLLSQNLYTEYYDCRGELIGTHSNPRETITLYKDDW